MISVICACNDQELLQKMLLPSLRRQTYTDWELICVNNREKGFSSAAETLNYGASEAKGDILLFVHQDIEFLTDDCLTKIREYCDTLEFGVAGAAGSVAREKCVYSSVLMDLDHRQAGKECLAPMDVDSLDECCFFMKRDGFKGFDDFEKTWHFYAVEYSLRCHLAGERVMVCPVPIYHLSPGWSLDNSYYATLKRVAKKYKKSGIRVISTTMGNYRLGPFLPFSIFLRKMKMKLKKLLKGKSV